MPKLLPCPQCGHTRSWTVRRHHRKCKRCRSEWSPRTHYPVNGFRIVRQGWHRIIESFLRDGVIKDVARECHTAFATAQRAVTRIRLVMTRDVPLILSGTCEADGTYVGGSWKNKAIHIRRQGSKRGRGTNKQAVFGIIQRDPSKVRIWIVPDEKARTTIPLIRRTVIKESTIYTDGQKGYRQLTRCGYHHDWIDHSAGEYVRGDVHTQTLDGYWGLLKNWLAATGGIRKRRLPYFIGEHQWRHNFRHLSRKEQVERIYELLTKFGGRS